MYPLDCFDERAQLGLGQARQPTVSDPAQKPATVPGWFRFLLRFLKDLRQAERLKG